MKVVVIKINGEWGVKFSYENQFFTLAYTGNKAQALWMSKMLRKCFKNYKLSLK